MTDKKSLKKAKPSQLGVLLKKARERKGVAQAELARIAGVSTRTIHSLETGVWTSVRDEVVIHLADALGQPAEEWVKQAGHEYDEEKAARIRQLHGYARRGLLRPKPNPDNLMSFEELVQQKEATVKTQDAKQEIWVIEAHRPAELRDSGLMKVVRDNVRNGVTYRYFYPIAATGTKPLDPQCWEQGAREAIDRIRHAVEQHPELRATPAAGKVVGYGVEPTEFPMFMYNMGTLIFYKEGNVESEQECYRIVNFANPKEAWAFLEDTTTASRFIQFLLEKVNAKEDSKQSSRGPTS